MSFVDGEWDGVNGIQYFALILVLIVTWFLRGG